MQNCIKLLIQWIYTIAAFDAHLIILCIIGRLYLFTLVYQTESSNVKAYGVCEIATTSSFQRLQTHVHKAMHVFIICSLTNGLHLSQY